MKQNLIIVGSIIAIAIIIGIFTRGGNTPEQAQREEGISDVAVNESAMEDKAMMEGDHNDEQAMEGSSSKLLAYSPEALAQATEDGDAVLFFHADWCPTCKAAEADFRANMDQIPENITILKANYDSESELKAKYGIVTQDTFVLVDAQGEAVAKWNSGGKGIQGLLSNIK